MPVPVNKIMASQPQMPCRVKSNVLMAALPISGKHWVDVTNMSTKTNGVAPSIVYGANGIKFCGGTWSDANNFTLRTGKSRTTHILVFQPMSTANVCQVFSARESAGSWSTALLNYDPANGLYVSRVGASTVNSEYIQIQDARSITAVLVVDNVKLINTLYCNGQKTETPSQAVHTYNNILSLGGTGNSARHAMHAVLPYVASDAEAFSLTANPWQLFLAPPTPIELSSGAITISLSDSGYGVDAMTNIAVEIGLTDAGVGVDTAPGASAGLVLSDAGTGADALTLAVAVQLADTGAGTDLVNLLTGQLISLADAGSGSDAISAVTVSLALADVGSGADATVIQAALQLADAGSGIDALSVLTATLIQILDAGSGADGLSIAVAVPVSDAGMGADLLAIQALVNQVESATGVDAVVRFDSASRIFSITFTVAMRRAVFTLAQRRAEFAFRRRQATFLLN